MLDFSFVGVLVRPRGQCLAANISVARTEEKYLRLLVVHIMLIS
jgi:hypothetical protein